MKRCPKCRNIVADRYKCRICGAMLAEAENEDAASEVIKFNGFYIKYLLKHAWFSLLSLAAAVFICAVSNVWDLYAFSSIGLCAISVLICLREHKLTARLCRKYSRDYAVFQIGIARYLSAALGLMTAVILPVIHIFT